MAVLHITSARQELTRLWFKSTPPCLPFKRMKVRLRSASCAQQNLRVSTRFVAHVLLYLAGAKLVIRGLYRVYKKAIDILSILKSVHLSAPSSSPAFVRLWKCWKLWTNLYLNPVLRLLSKSFFFTEFGHSLSSVGNAKTCDVFVFGFVSFTTTNY